MADGTTCLHLSIAHGHIEYVRFRWRLTLVCVTRYSSSLSSCIRALVKYGANPFVENHLGLTSWHCLSKLNETIELECLHVLVDINQILVRYCHVDIERQ
jgi:hypothetical protein